jgi:hypothetical protein
MRRRFGSNFFGDEIDRITRFEPLTGHTIDQLTTVTIYPGKQFVTPHEKLLRAQRTIREELDQRIIEFERDGKLLEAQRIKMRTEYDLEMLQEMGFCSGIENYSRHLSGRPAGSRPFTLLDFFPRDFLCVIDESHASVPQNRRHVRGRSLPQDCPGQLWFPASLRARQSPAEVPGVHGYDGATPVRQRHSGRVRVQEFNGRGEELRTALAHPNWAGRADSFCRSQASA